MSLLLPGTADAAPSPPLCLLPVVRSHCRALVMVAGGGRDLDWSPDRVALALRQAVSGRLVQLLLHGGARGADRAIDSAAHRLGWPAEAMPAQWARYGLAAGPVRNGQMLRRATEEAATHGRTAPTGVLVIAFPGRAGTASLLQQARRLQGHTPLPIEVIDLGA
ncbi:MAG: SLOG family protein [Cyanobacteriota bacterium]|nr:SLOG family protein [Cyanobacteriota bacterium]